MNITHALVYRNWSAIVRDIELTDDETREAEAILEHHATWGDNAYTLVAPKVAVYALTHAIRGCNRPGHDTEEMVQYAVDAVNGYLVNLEA